MTASTRRYAFLFCTWEGGGNVPPMLVVARKPVARGHDVRVMSDLANRPEIEAVGATFVSWTEAPSRPDKSRANDIVRDWDAPDPVEGIGRVIDNVICGPALAYARDVLAEHARAPADVVISSDLIMGPMAAAEAAGVPLAVLSANVSLFPVPGIPPMGPGLLPATTDEERALHAEIANGNRALFARGRSALNACREALGLAPLDDVLDQLQAAQRQLIATARAFDFAPDTLPEGHVYVGPQLDLPASFAPWGAPWPADDERPLLLVSLSTTFQNQGAVLQRVLDGVRDLPLRVFVTTGPALADETFRAGDNTRLVAHAPHGSVMAAADAVLCHGGHGTVIRALASGVPLVVLPMGRDQNDNAARVQAKGAGLMLSPESASDAIRAAVQRVLAEPSFAERAVALGAEIRAESERSTVVAELEALARANAPGRCAA